MEKTASLAALFLVLYVSHDALGQEDVVVAAHVGEESVSLPFIMNLGSLSDPSVQWIRGTSEIVHFRVKQGDQLKTQSSVFKDRTRMNPDSFQTGNLTLVLSKPTVSDTGFYTCVVKDGPTVKASITVALSVTDPPPPGHAWLIGVGVGVVGVGVVGVGVVGVVVGVLLTVVTQAVRRQKKTRERLRAFTDGLTYSKTQTESQLPLSRRGRSALLSSEPN